MNPRQLFELLLKQVEDLLALGSSQISSSAGSARSIFRACIVLSVSALDTFMHEKAADIFASLERSTPRHPGIAQYLSIPPGSLNQQQLASNIRYRLSFKTLVTPAAIDRAIAATGANAGLVWQSIGADLGARESRLRNMLDLQVDRRNLIAHEADWDPAQLTFRRISSDHVEDCLDCVGKVVRGIDRYWV
jgi:hypothetical protein